MVPISFIIITLNEEKWIGRCIRNLQPLNTEIIVVDSGSTDKTVTIAKELGVQVLQHTWKGYAHARNTGAEKASNLWVCHIDADEMVTPELLQSITKIPFNLTQNVYAIDIVNHFGDIPVKYSDWYPDFTPRLYNSTVAKWSGDIVHETIVSDSKFNLIRLKGKVLHYTVQDEKEHAEKLERYAALGAQKLFNKGYRYNPIIMEVKALWRWLRTYVLKQGFRDGHIGLYLSNANAHMIRRRFQILRQMRKDAGLPNDFFL